MSLSAALTPDALPELLTLLQRYRCEEASVPHGPGARGGPRSPRPLRGDGGPFPEAMLGPDAVAVRAAVAALPLNQLFALLPGCRFGDKLLLIIAGLEAQGTGPVGRFEVRHHLALAGATASANPGRDMRSLEAEGLILHFPAKQIQLTEAGWLRVGKLLGARGGDDEAPGTAPVPA